MREIGSEFWTTESCKSNYLITDKNHRFLLTGRTVIDHIIQDIKQAKGMKAVYMPSYCCHTMVRPFLDNNVEVKFYNIGFEDGKYTYEIDFNTPCDTVFVLQYFGYTNEMVSRIIEVFKEKGKTIIEDATHLWFSEYPFNNNSDYVFASFRKWTGLACGAIVVKQSGNFKIKAPSVTNIKYVELRKSAADMKKDYIEKGIDNKEEFLNIFSQAEELIEKDYHNYNIPNDIEDIIKKLDFNKIKNIRKSNADYLIEKLKKYTNIKTIIKSKDDVPLFVPIIICNGERDKLRRHLINNNIYCPIHWPLSDEQTTDNLYLYNNSLSLVCDQRYDLTDMERIIECINNFFEKGV